MKCRNGFVSNSSSSSFVILTKAETFDMVLSKESENLKAFVKALEKTGIVERSKVFGMDMAKIGYGEGNSDTFEYGPQADLLREFSTNDDDEYGEGLEEELSEFVNKLRDLPKKDRFLHEVEG
jgi:hypothetical protein